MNHEPTTSTVLTYCFDIDGTICSNTDGQYEEADPFHDRIAKINSLYEEGHRIVYFTARGSTTGMDWGPTTEKQLASWGAKYHELVLGKPFADIYVDDRALNADQFCW